MPRYVILEHDHPALHWDFMLEAGQVLRTWRLSAPPRVGAPIPAVASFDHRPIYLSYEGPVSGDRGRVVRWDAGTFQWESDAPGRVSVRLHGARLQGRAVLEEIEGEAWLFSVGG
jgi:DNA polymerase ligase (LigD)-like protein